MGQGKDIFQEKIHAQKKFQYAVLMNQAIEHTKLDENVIFYESNFGKKIAGAPYAAFRTFLQDPDRKDLIHVWSLEEMETDNVYEAFKKHPNVKFVKRRSEEYFEWLAKAKYVVNNRQFPYYYVRRSGQRFVRLVQVFETGMFDNKYRFVKEQSYLRNILQATHLVVESEEVKQKLLNVNHMNEWGKWEILVCPMDRWNKKTKEPVKFAVQLGKQLFDGEQAEFEVQKPNEKKNILFYSGKMFSDEIAYGFLHLMESECLDRNLYNIHMVVENTQEESQQQLINQIPDDVSVHIKYGPALCNEKEYLMEDDIRKEEELNEEQKKLLKGYYKKESRRQFGNLKFDSVWNFGQDDTWWNYYMDSMETPKSYVYKDVVKGYCLLHDKLKADAGAVSKKLEFDGITYNVVEKGRESRQIQLEGFATPDKDKTNYVYTVSERTLADAAFYKKIDRILEDENNVVYIVTDFNTREELQELLEENEFKDRFSWIMDLINPYPFIKECDCYIMHEDNITGFGDVAALDLGLKLACLTENGVRMLDESDKEIETKNAKIGHNISVLLK